MSVSIHRNPRLIALAIAMITVAGLSALYTLPRQEDPTLTNRIALILAPFPGASPERVESLVTRPLEDALREVANIKLMESTSRAGIATISLELADHLRDTRKTLSDIRATLDDTLPELPKGLPRPLLDDKRFGAYTMLIALRWTEGNAANRAILNRYGKALQDALRSVPNTSMVELWGAQKEEIYVQVDPHALNDAGLSVQQLAQQIQQADTKLAAGAIRSQSQNLLIELQGELTSIERIRNVILRRDHQGRMLRVADVATVHRRTQTPPRDVVISQGRPSIVVATKIETDRRVDRWAERSQAELSAFQQRLPEGIALDVIFDQSHYTQTRLESLVWNLAMGIALVFAILLITLGWRAAALVAIALPLTTAASLAVLDALDVPIHQMSVTGLIVALGLLVDNAIVMVDAVQYRLQQGKSTDLAVRESIRKLWLPLLSSTITTALAFTPILLLPGPTGEFVSAIAISVIAAVASSYLLSITILSALGGYMLKRPEAEDDTNVHNSALRRRIPGSVGLKKAFRRSIAWSLNHPKTSLLIASIPAICGLLASTQLTQQFFPPTERDQINLEIMLQPSRPIHYTGRVVKTADRLIRAHKEIEATHWFIGRSAPPFYYNLKQNQDGNAAYAQAQIKVRSAKAAQQLIPRLQQELDKALPEAQILVREILQGPPVDAPLEVRFYGPELTQLQALGETMRRRMTQVQGITQTQASIDSGRVVLDLDTNLDEISQSGLDLAQLAGRLQTQLEGIPAGLVLEGRETLGIRIGVSDAARASLSDTQGMELQSTPLASLATFGLKPAQAAIAHRNGRRTNIVRGYLQAGLYPDMAFQQLQDILAQDPLTLPEGYRMEFGGDVEKRSDTLGELFSSIGIIALLMLSTIVLTFQSFRFAGLVFVVALQSMALGVLAISLAGYPMGFLAINGLFGLVGVAINAAIIIIASLRNAFASQQFSSEVATSVVVDECSRHIVSTTLTTGMGFLPLILEGGGFWPPFAIVIAGGVVFSAIVSFYFVPAAYTLLRPKQQISHEASPTLQPQPINDTLRDDIDIELERDNSGVRSLPQRPPAYLSNSDGFAA